MRSGKRQDKKVDVIKIEKGKMMVVLTNEDMAKYHIGSDMSFGEGAKISGEVLRRIAQDAAASVGENMCGGGGGGAEMPRMLIRMFASKGGGCEMFISQLPCGEYTQSAEHVHKSQKHIYMFDSMENLLAACRKLMCGGVGESRLWADNERRAYYLELGEERGDMCEFGAVRLYGGAKYYLAEHCRLICTDAIRRMGTLA